MTAPPPVDHVSFLTPLRVEYLDGVSWKVYEEFDFASEVLERIIRMLPGETTDFASVPKAFQNILGPTIAVLGPAYGKAAALHDKCYRTPGYCSKDLADHVFLEAMEALGVEKLVMDALYEAVHLFGGASYKGGVA